MTIFDTFYHSCERNKTKKREAKAKKHKLAMIRSQVKAKARYVYKIGPRKLKQQALEVPNHEQ